MAWPSRIPMAASLPCSTARTADRPRSPWAARTSSSQSRKTAGLRLTFSHSSKVGWWEFPPADLTLCTGKGRLGCRAGRMLMRGVETLNEIMEPLPRVAAGLAAFLSTSLAAAATYYVGPTGAGEECTRAAPCALPTGAAVAVAGDTVV